MLFPEPQKTLCNSLHRPSSHPFDELAELNEKFAGMPIEYPSVFSV